MPTHVKRDLNQWADDLTHPSFEGFDTALRRDVVRLLTSLQIFPWILRHLDQRSSSNGDSGLLLNWRIVGSTSFLIWLAKAHGPYLERCFLAVHVSVLPPMVSGRETRWVWCGWNLVHLTKTIYFRPRSILVSHIHLPTGQSCANWHPKRRSKSADCCCWGAAWVVTSVGLFSWLADINIHLGRGSWMP